MFDNDGYVKASVDVVKVESVVSVFVDSFLTGDAVNDRRVLSVLGNRVQDCVDFVMGNLPVGVSRVDGYVVRPILEKVVSVKLNDLPVEEVEEFE